MQSTTKQNPKSGKIRTVSTSLKAITMGLTVMLVVALGLLAFEYLTSNLAKPLILITFSYVLSALLVANIFLWTMYTIMYVRGRKLNKLAKRGELRGIRDEVELSDIIRDETGFPSLATFQFLIWTFIISFVFLAIFFIRWFYGVPLLPSILPDNLFVLMGISIAVPVVSTGVSQVKYGARPSTTETIEESDRRNLTSMFMENGKLTVFRFQMFAWTWITVVTYLIAFSSYTIDTLMLADRQVSKAESIKIIKSLEIRDVPQIYVVLMGLSQGAYIGSKMAISRIFSITMIMPTKVSKADIKSGKEITILGTNFGTDTSSQVWFEPKSPPNADWIGPFQPPRESVSENRIRLKFPEGLEPKEYYVRVESKGMLTDRKIKEDLDADIRVTGEEQQETKIVQKGPSTQDQ